MDNKDEEKLYSYFKRMKELYEKGLPVRILHNNDIFLRKFDCHYD